MTPTNKVLALLAAGALLSGCGATAPNRNAPAGDEVVQGGVTYDIQTSRELNPFIPDDRALLAGVAPGRLDPRHDVLLGVFLQADDDGTRAHRAIGAPELVSAEGQVYRPLRLPAVDPFAYRGGLVQPKGELPAPETPAAESPDNASVLVYRLPSSVFLTNRPFTVRFGPSARAASVQLDF